MLSIDTFTPYTGVTARIGIAIHVVCDLSIAIFNMRCIQRHDIYAIISPRNQEVVYRDVLDHKLAIVASDAYPYMYV